MSATSPRAISCFLTSHAAHGEILNCNSLKSEVPELGSRTFVLNAALGGLMHADNSFLSLS